jgi:hypothetical protein
MFLASGRAVFFRVHHFELCMVVFDKEIVLATMEAASTVGWCIICWNIVSSNRKLH